jgi:hypothetical protein
MQNFEGDYKHYTNHGHLYLLTTIRVKKQLKMPLPGSPAFVGNVYGFVSPGSANSCKDARLRECGGDTAQVIIE